MRPLHTLVLLAALAPFLGGFPRAAAADAATALPGDLSAEQADRIYAQSWKDLSHFYIGWKGEFYAFPDYSKDYPGTAIISSHRVTEKMYAAAPALATLTQTYQDDNGIEKKRTLKKEQAEVEAAVKALPGTHPGDYGWIHSGRVERVEGADSAILRQVQLVDPEDLADRKQKVRDKLINQDVADYTAKVHANNSRPRERGAGHGLIAQYAGTQREAYQWWFAERDRAAERQHDEAFQFTDWRVVGFKTNKMSVGSRWPSGDKGVQVAILAVKDRTVLAAPAALLEKGMKEEEFLALLGKIGVSKATFALLVREAKKRDEKGWTALVMKAFENGGKLPALEKKAVEPVKKAPEQGQGGDVELAK